VNPRETWLRCYLPVVKTPSPAALLDRARTLIVRMHGVERWAYAIDLGVPMDRVHNAIVEAGYTRAEEDVAARVSRYEGEAPLPPSAPPMTEGLVTLERPDLGVTLLQAYGPGTPDRLAGVLEKTGFIPQSRLLRQAYDPGHAEAKKALTTLAHMVVAWDDDWADLFLLHLASPDPIVRHDAALATVVAALSARAREPARTLLNEAHVRERLPQLKETLAEALEAVLAIPEAAS
jgi:hypothetical protein